MAQIVKLRRSSVSGQKPTNSNLQLGELALNTTDGKVFMAVSGSGGPSVEELILTNTVNTGSINLIGSISASHVSSSFIGDGSGLYNIPLTGVTDLVTISSSLDGRLDVLETYSGSYTGSFSGSIDGRGQVDYLTFNTSSAPLTAPSYSLWANTQDRTLNLQMGNNATNQLGQELYYPPVVNKTGGPLTDGTLVMVNPTTPSFGNRLNIVKAISDGTYPADLIVGILTEDIPNNETGFATWFGYVRNIPKSQIQPVGETWVEGDILYPHPTIHGALTKILPVAPALKSTIAAVTRINGNNVTILVRPNLRGAISGQHDVNIVGSASDGDLFVRSGSVWTNSKSLLGDYNVTGSLTITQNLTVLGSSSFVYVTSSQLAVSNSFISVNVFEPAERFGGLKVYDSGSESHQATASLAWDSLYNRWVYQNASGSNYSGGILIAGPRNSGSLGDETTLTNGYLPKSVGGDHIDNSIISESGTVITVHGSLIANSLTGSIDFGQITNVPTLVSGSSQIEITSTTGYSTFSSSLNSSVETVSSSVAITTNTLDGRIDSLETESGSIRGEFNSYTSSTDGRLFAIETESGSIRSEFNSYTSSTDDRLASIETESGSIRTEFNSYTSSTDDRLTSIETESGSIRTEFNSYTSSTDDRLQSIETESGSIRTAFNSFTSSYNTGSFTGSFIGDGSGLYNIPASGVTGLQLDKIINGNASASIDDTGLYVNRDLYVAGTITAEQIHTTYVTSSVLYQSGSTKFGDTSDDTHQITGSLLVSGSITTEDLFVNGNIQLGLGDPYDRIIINAQFSSSLYPDSDGDHALGAPLRRWKVFGTTGSFNHIHGISGSTVTIDSAAITGSMSGSFTGDASGLVNVPFVITGSDVNGVNYDKQFSKLHFDSDTGLNVSESAPGTAFISIGSHFRDIFVSGSDMLRATGSDAFEITSEGGVTITTSITDTNSNGYVKELHFSTTELSSSLNTRIENITGSINNLTSSFNDLTNSFDSLTSSFNTYTSSIDSFTSSVVLTSETSSMTVLSASYALTAAFALNAGGGSNGGVSDGAYALLEQTAPSTTWTFNHNLGQKYPIFQVFDDNDNVIIPSQITAVNSSTATITFPTQQTGRVIGSLGTGPGGMSQFFSSATTWSLSHNMGTDYPIVTVYNNDRKIVFPQEVKSIDTNNIEVYFSTPVSGYLNVSKGGHIISGSVSVDDINLDNSGIVSSSVQIANYGYAVTGSNTFTSNQVINGSLTINKAKLDSNCLTLSSGIDQTIFDLNGFDGANFDYVIKSGSNMRAGMIMSVWDGLNVSYNEVSTTDLGDTSAVTFHITNTGVLKTDIASGTWSIECMYRALKCS